MLQIFYQGIILVSCEEIACVYFFFYVVKLAIIAICNDNSAGVFKLLEIIYAAAAHKFIRFERRLVYDRLNSVGKNALHNALYA